MPLPQTRSPHGERLDEEASTKWCVRRAETVLKCMKGLFSL